MVNILCCISASSPFWNYINFFLALFAAFVAVGYFLKPRLKYGAYLSNSSKLCVKVENKNLFLTVKDIKCEMAVSKLIYFEKSKTLDLVKDYTLFIRRTREINGRDYPRDYVFISGLTLAQIQEGRPLNNEYKFLRIRMLALNFLGVKKYYERIYRIENIGNIGNIVLQYNCQHKQETKDLIITELNLLNH